MNMYESHPLARRKPLVARQTARPSRRPVPARGAGHSSCWSASSSDAALRTERRREADGAVHRDPAQPCLEYGGAPRRQMVSYAFSQSLLTQSARPRSQDAPGQAVQRPAVQAHQLGIRRAVPAAPVQTSECSSGMESRCRHAWCSLPCSTTLRAAKVDNLGRGLPPARATALTASTTVADYPGARRQSLLAPRARWPHKQGFRQGDYAQRRAVHWHETGPATSAARRFRRSSAYHRRASF